MSSDFLPQIASYLRAIRHDRFDGVVSDPSIPEAARDVVREINALNEDRTRILNENQARYRLIINSTPIAICITNEYGNYEYANPEYLRLTGYSEQELLGRHFSLVVPEADRDALSDLHDEFMGRRYELEGQWTIVHKDGHEIPILANAAYIIDTDGDPKKVTYVVDIVELVAARTRLEEEIERRKINEQIRDQVERVMRHDLRNPIDGIQTAAEFLLQDEKDPRRKEFIRLMLNAAQQAREQIDNSLAYARMQRGRYVLQRSRLNAVQLLRSVKRRMDGILTAHDVELVLSYNGEMWANAYDIELWGEQGFLTDAITNLVRNAIEASGRGERVTIDLREDVCGASGRHVVSIVIGNNGDIPEEIRGRVFEPYVTSGKSNGTGLGAYTADLVVRAHGGTIDVETGDGNGTRVRVVLPRARYGEENEG